MADAVLERQKRLVRRVQRQLVKNRIKRLAHKSQFAESDVLLNVAPDTMVAQCHMNERCHIVAKRKNRFTRVVDKEVFKLRIVRMGNLKPVDNKGPEGIVFITETTEFKRKLEIPFAGKIEGFKPGERPIFAVFDGPSHIISWDLPEEYETFQDFHKALFEAGQVNKLAPLEEEKIRDFVLDKDRDADECMSNNGH